jgi:hypothetical protein
MSQTAFLALAAAALVGGCAATPEQQARTAERRADSAARLDKALAGFTAEQPQSCMPITNPRRTEYYGDTIIYEVSGNLVYRNDTTGGCALERDDILVTSTPLGRLCRGDIARTVDRASRFNTGSCALGDFVPYRKRRS